MNRAKDLLLTVPGLALFGQADAKTLATLKEIAAIWRDEGKLLNAGFVMSIASRAAWGNGDEVQACTRQAIDDYQSCVNTSEADSHEGLVALTKLGSEVRQWFVGDLRITEFLRSVDAELARRLASLSRTSDHRCSYLVTGLQVGTDFDGPWSPVWPGQPLGPDTGPVSVSVAFGSHSEGSVGHAAWVGVPGAFSLLLGAADHKGAFQITEQCPDEFRSVNLAGWVPALNGLLRLQDPATAFDEAARLFAADTAPQDQTEIVRRGGWSGANVLLWAKYFKALSLLERAKSDAVHAPELVAEASRALAGTESGLVNPQVSRLRVTVRALAGVLGVQPSLRPREARNELALQAQIFGQEEGDQAGIQFFSVAEATLGSFERDPARALTDGDLQALLTALENLPLVGSDLARAVRPAIGQAALRTILGPVRTWVHRALEAIRDEAQLRRVVLRLVQASTPLYAQIRHGPIEYGKDIAVLIEKDSVRTLRMYQVKVGDLTLPVWRNATHELEEAFLVPLESIQIREPVTEREGILVCNGHANPYVEPLIGPWIVEQARAYGRRLRFMHLDDLVNWIVNDRLVNEFRTIATELGLPTA
jgi:hypothetical protein